ncbi:alpha/beta fold hydrolase [Mycobacterium sp. 050134]|uniref:alpha/beta fold hydrolase n=1 Tax=Mycobacterium sp. 050134 TaxID=3096111 RepID=UPI002EDB88C8
MTRPHDAPTGSSRTTTFQGFGGLQLAADEWLRSGQTVLMLHGGGQNRHSWKKTGQVLADNGFHVIILDGRGHGDSEWASDGDYSIDAFTSDARAVVDQVGKPVVVVGASLGGMTGILLARILGPEKVIGLLLVDIVPRVETVGTDRIRDFMSSGMEGFESLDEAAEAVAAYLPHRTKPRSPQGLTKNLRLRDGRWFWHWDPAFLANPENSPIGRTDEIKRAAAELAVPVLLIRGKLSDVVSQEGAEEFLRDVPTAEFAELSGAGHTAAGDDNDAFSDAVLDFVKRVKS